jgi:hypothetical protein
MENESDPIQQPSLKLVLSLTEAMKHKAEILDIDELKQLELKRQQAIELVFPITTPSLSDRRTLEDIISINSEIEKICNKAKIEIQSQLLTMNGNKKAVSAYQQK